MNDLNKIKQKEEKIKELEDNIRDLMAELGTEMPSTYKVLMVHPAEYVFLKFLREELIHGKISNLNVAQGLPTWSEYHYDNGVIKRVKFDSKEDVGI